MSASIKGSFLVPLHLVHVDVNATAVPAGLPERSFADRYTGNAFAYYPKPPTLKPTSAQALEFEQAVSATELQRKHTGSIPSWASATLSALLNITSFGLYEAMLSRSQRALIDSSDLLGKEKEDATPGRNCAKVLSKSDCQRRSFAENYEGDNSMTSWLKWHSQLDRLDGLVHATGKYAQLRIVQNLWKKWQTSGSSEAARLAYDAWKRTGSYLRFMDALVAEWKESGDYQRLVQQRIDINKKNGRYESDVRKVLELFPGENRKVVEERMLKFLTDWDQFRGESRESEVFGKKWILQLLLEGELEAEQWTTSGDFQGTSDVVGRR